MKHLFFNFNRLLLLGLAVMTMSVNPAWCDTSFYTCGFESSESFTASTSYTGNMTGGASGKQWTISKGAWSTSSKITDSQSAALRMYNSSGKDGYLKTDFTLNNLTYFTFKAKAATTNGSKFKIDIQYSTDGTNWSNMYKESACTNAWSAQQLTTSAASYSAYMPTADRGKKNVYIRIAVNSGSTYPSKSNTQLTIDDIEAFKAAASPELTTSASSLAFGNVESGSNKSLSTLTVSGANLTDDITYAISGTNASFFSVTSPSSPISKGTGTVSATTITVKYAPTATGSHTAKLTFSSTGATAKEVTLTGTGTTPPCSTSPVVAAGSAGSATTSSLTFNCSGGITTIGSNCSITSYGYVWGTSENPTISNSKHEIGTSYASASTAFAAYTASGLNCSTTYYMRPYATNGNGTSYGTQASASTSDCPVDVFIDNMHSTGDFASPGKSFNAAYTKAAITISDKTPTAPTGVCATDHYHFVGWITAATKSSKTPPYADGDLVSFNESSNAPTGTTYYAVWAKEAQ